MSEPRYNPGEFVSYLYGLGRDIKKEKVLITAQYISMTSYDDSLRISYQIKCKNGVKIVYERDLEDLVLCMTPFWKQLNEQV